MDAAGTIMQRRRALEMLGSFALGGGLVAMAYELGGRAPQVTSEPVAAGAEVPGEVAASGSPADTPTPEPAPMVAGDPAKDPFKPGPEGAYEAFPPVFDPPQALDAAAEAKYPKHGLVTGQAVLVRERTEKDARIVGILRAGARVRADVELSFGGGCTKGWHAIYPAGWICLNAGLAIGDTPPDDGAINIPKPRLEEAMPYEYWRVSHDGTPFFHRLPSFGEADQADAAAKAWMAVNGRAPIPMSGPDRPVDVPAVVKEYLNAGYYVTVAGEALKSERKFLRTLRGVFARKYQLEQREGSSFTGMLLNGEADLPVYWIVRETALQRRASEGSESLVKTDAVIPARRSRYPFKRKVTIGNAQFYEDDDGLLMPAYAVGQSYKLRRPPGVGVEERWVHVDLSEQVLVAYQGDTPVFTTLVSTGREPGMTPIGVHRLQSKHVATSMRDQPIEDDAYSIEDVPWTQYFHNSVALHGAFWHGGFGLIRSHGCVNLSPSDARWLFGFTEAHLPDGWHAMSPDVASFARGSAVVITE